MGSVISGLTGSLGVTSQYRAPTVYSSAVLQDQLNKSAEIYGGQSGLAQALQAQMAGAGPNPAQLQYAQNVQNNVANAQGLISSQRGLNPALAARLGASAASDANQRAALNSALLQQQQQLGAQSQLGGLYGQMQQRNLGQQQLYNQSVLGVQGLNQQTMAQNAAINAGVLGGIMSGVSGGMAKTAGGGSPTAAPPLAQGGKVPGKANVSGDSQENDVVPAMLSPGEIVIPRSKADDPEKAKEFIDHLLKSKPKDEKGYGGVLEHKRKVADLEKRIKALEGKK